MAGRFAQITMSNEETKKRHSDSSLNASELRNEKVSMIKQDVEKAPALSVPKTEIQPKKTEESGGRFQQLQKSAQTQKEENRQYRDSFDPENPVLDFIKDNTVDALAGALDRLRFDSKPGQFLDRMSQAGTRLSGVQPEYEATTGSKIADTAADVAGSIAGVFVNPTGPTSSVAGQASIVGQAYNNPLTQRLAAQAGARFGKPTAQRVASEAVREGITGVVEGGAQAAIRGEPLGNIATQAAIGGGLGTGLGALVPAAGAGLKNVAEKIPGFTEVFGNKGVGISPMGSTKRTGGPVSTEDVIVTKAIKSDTDSIKAGIAANVRAGYQNLVDALSPLKKVNRETYETAIDSARASNIANNIIGKDFVTPEGVRIGDGLETIFGKVKRGTDRQFMDYLILRDAEARVARGERVYDESLGMTPEKIRERATMLENRYPEFAAVAKDWDAFTKNLRETFGLKEGLLNEKQMAAMVEARPFYTPMRRQFSRSEKPGRKFIQSSTGSSFSGQKAPIKKVSPTGSTRDIIDPRKTMIEAVGAFVGAAMRNRVGQQLVRAIRENPDALKGIARIAPDTTAINKSQAMKKSIDEINEIIETDGMEGLIEKLNGDFEIAFKKGSNSGGKENTVTIMENGKPVRIILDDPEVFKAMEGLSPQQAGVLINILSHFSNAIKRGATGALAPLFAARSVTTDLVQAIIQSKNPARHSVDLVHALFSSIGDKLNIPGLRNLAEEFRLSGGEYSAALRGERQLNKGLGRLRRDPLLHPRNLGRMAGKALLSPIRIGESISDISENINRIAAYKGEMRRLGGERTPENVRKAITAGREITTNFSRKGRFSQELEALFPYQNAAVQGTYRVMKAFKENPVKTGAAVLALSVLPKLTEYAQFHDDPDYLNLPARERFRNLIVSKNEDGSFVKIPMEPAYNTFGELTIMAMQRYRDDDPQAFKGAVDALMNAWVPPAASGILQGATQGTGIEGSIGGTFNATSVAPFAAVYSNQSFTGAPIVPQRLEGRSAGREFDERTSAPAKWLGEKLGFSPMKTDYLLRAFGGDAARLLLPLTSDVGAGTPRNTLLKNFIVDPVLTNTLADDFYTAKDRIIAAKTDNADVDAPLPKWYSEELYKLVNSRAKGSASARLSDLNAEKREVNGDKTLTAQQKTDRIRDIQAEINDIYLEVNSKLETAGVPMPNR